MAGWAEHHSPSLSTKEPILTWIVSQEKFEEQPDSHELGECSLQHVVLQVMQWKINVVLHVKMTTQPKQGSLIEA